MEVQCSRLKLVWRLSSPNEQLWGVIFEVENSELAQVRLETADRKLGTLPKIGPD